MIRRILALGAISMAATLAQTPAPKAAPAAAPAKPAAPAKAPAAASSAAKYVPPKTPWGEPDLQGLWPLNHLISVPYERNAQYGDRLFMNDEEFAKAQKAVEARDSRFQSGPIPQADSAGGAQRQTSLIYDPKNGRFPGLTDYGKKLQAEMKDSYRPGQTVFDSVEDFSAWDHCITRGMPVSMLPRNYNNGIRIMQSPGYVIIVLEMAHEARVIPTNGMPPLDPQIHQWMGESRGHWEGNTLVVETKNFNGLVGKSSGGVPGGPRQEQPESTSMKTTERFTRVGPKEIEFKMTIEDPEINTPPSYSVQYSMYLDNKYEMFEYACHEGNTAIRNYIQTSRYERTHPKSTPPAK